MTVVSDPGLNLVDLNPTQAMVEGGDEQDSRKRKNFERFIFGCGKGNGKGKGRGKGKGSATGSASIWSPAMAFLPGGTIDLQNGLRWIDGRAYFFPKLRRRVLV